MTSWIFALWETGITDDVSPEEAKHIRFFNTGASIGVLLSLLIALTISILARAILIHSVVAFLLSFMLAGSILLNKFQKYTLARVYGVLLLYTVIMLNFVYFIGEDYFGQFYIMLVTMAMFLIFPRSESTLMHLIILLGFTCFTISMLFYNPLVNLYISELIRTGDLFFIQSPIPAFVLFLIFIALGYVFRHIWLATEEKLRIERERSEQLLLNILPSPVAERLKKGEQTIADAFEETTVLFADIVGFTTLSAQTPPTELVALLNTIFSAFDDLTETHGLEKIKTIGDAYMVAAGLPEHREAHAQAIAAMARDMCRIMGEYNATTGHSLQLRIGINSGSVVAGVIGKKKFIYDLWGDAVNIAARMESHGIPGEIQVSQATYELLKGSYIFEERGLIGVKGKGPMRVYLLKERR
jgi:adenylate cyclase